MILAHAQPKTGHPNCRRPDKVIDAGHKSMCIVTNTDEMNNSYV